MNARERERLESHLSAYLDDELTPDERGEVESFLESDADARALLAELRATIQAVQSLPRARASDDLLDHIRGRMERQALLGDEPATLPEARGGGFSGRWLAAAAVVALACLSGYLVWLLGEPGPTPGHDSSYVRESGEGREQGMLAHNYRERTLSKEPETVVGERLARTHEGVEQEHLDPDEAREGGTAALKYGDDPFERAPSEEMPALTSTDAPDREPIGMDGDDAHDQVHSLVDSAYTQRPDTVIAGEDSDRRIVGDMSLAAIDEVLNDVWEGGRPEPGLFTHAPYSPGGQQGAARHFGVDASDSAVGEKHWIVFEASHADASLQQRVIDLLCSRLSHAAEPAGLVEALAEPTQPARPEAMADAVKTKDADPGGAARLLYASMPREIESECFRMTGARPGQENEPAGSAGIGSLPDVAMEDGIHHAQIAVLAVEVADQEALTALLADVEHGGATEQLVYYIDSAMRDDAEVDGGLRSSSAVRLHGLLASQKNTTGRAIQERPEGYAAITGAAGTQIQTGDEAAVADLAAEAPSDTFAEIPDSKPADARQVPRDSRLLDEEKSLSVQSMHVARAPVEPSAASERWHFEGETSTSAPALGMAEGMRDTHTQSDKAGARRPEQARTDSELNGGAVDGTPRGRTSPASPTEAPSLGKERAVDMPGARAEASIRTVIYVRVRSGVTALPASGEPAATLFSRESPSGATRPAGVNATAPAAE